VLVDSIAAGRPVIATAFPHAVEMLKSGAGLVVPHKDPQAMADAIRSILTSQKVADEMSAEARHLARFFSWNVVASEYALQVDELVRAKHLVRT
ncbi:MAG TPA: glycosyltransferase, partial [archaeon]|nr:glycosyltransferase [archaeon]